MCFVFHNVYLKNSLSYIFDRALYAPLTDIQDIYKSYMLQTVSVEIKLNIIDLGQTR